MPLLYKADVLELLKAHNYTTYKLRKAGLLSEGAIQSLRAKKPISWANIEQLCRLLNCQPGDFMEYVPDEETAPEDT